MNELKIKERTSTSEWMKQKKESKIDGFKGFETIQPEENKENRNLKE